MPKTTINISNKLIGIFMLMSLFMLIDNALAASSIGKSKNSHVGSLDSKTTITAGNKLTLKGAQAIGKGVAVSAKELHIESLQDSAVYDSKQKSMGGSITIGTGISGSVSFSKSNIDADHLAVGEQSVIVTGDGVQKEIDLQVEVTQSFDKTRQGVNQLINEKISALKVKVENGESDQSELDNLEMAGLVVSGIGGALYTPNANGLLGDAAQMAAPYVAKQIGDYFAQPGNDNEAAHGVAHAVLAAAVAAAGGNDALSAGLAAGGAELAAPVISKYLYGNIKPEDLTAEQKKTVSNIASLAGAAAGATTGNATDIAASTTAATNAVDNNWLLPHENIEKKKIEKRLDKLMSNGECQLTSECEVLKKRNAELTEVSDKRDNEFNDAYYSCREEAQCEKFHDIHVKLRIELNKKGVENFKKDLKAGRLHANWRTVDNNKNAFHNYSEDGKTILEEENGLYQNIKYVDQATGQYEVILDRKFLEDQNMDKHYVDLPSSTGTFNFYKAESLSNIGHVDFDVDTWMDLGSGNGDNTTYDSRKDNSGVTGYFLGEFNELNIDRTKRLKSWMDMIKHDINYQNRNKK